MAAQMLSGKGFNSVYNVSGGIKAWEAEVAIGPQDLGLHLFSESQSPEDILKVAYSLEDGLREFYLSMSDKVENDRVRDLFVKLSKIEVQHQASIIRAYEELGHEKVSQEEFSAMVTQKAMEGGLTTQEYLDLFNPDLESEIDVISLAMSIEAQALDLYQRVGADLPSEASLAIIGKIADEEKQHLASLGRLMDGM